MEPSRLRINYRSSSVALTICLLWSSPAMADAARGWQDVATVTRDQADARPMTRDTVDPVRRDAEAWMLMMQRMAGIAPEYSRWVASQLAAAPENRVSTLEQYLRLGIGPSRMYPMPETTELPDGFQVPERTAEGRPVMSRAEWDQNYGLIGTVPLPGGYVHYLRGLGVLPGSGSSGSTLERMEAHRTSGHTPSQGGSATQANFEGIQITALRGKSFSAATIWRSCNVISTNNAAR